jgi:hypothetical protein
MRRGSSGVKKENKLDGYTGMRVEAAIRRAKKIDAENDFVAQSDIPMKLNLEFKDWIKEGCKVQDFKKLLFKNQDKAAILHLLLDANEEVVDVGAFVIRLLDSGLYIGDDLQLSDSHIEIIKQAFRDDANRGRDYHQKWAERYLDIIRSGQSPNRLIELSCGAITNFKGRAKVVEAFVGKINTSMHKEVVIEALKNIAKTLDIRELPENFFYKKPVEIVNALLSYLPQSSSLSHALREGRLDVANEIIERGHQISHEAIEKAILTPEDNRTIEQYSILRFVKRKDLFVGEPKLIEKLMGPTYMSYEELGMQRGKSSRRAVREQRRHSDSSLTYKDKIKSIESVYLFDAVDEASTPAGCGIVSERNIRKCFGILLKIYSESGVLNTQHLSQFFHADNIDIKIKIDVARNIFGDGSLNLLDATFAYIERSKLSEKAMYEYLDKLVDMASKAAVKKSDVIDTFTATLPKPFEKVTNACKLLMKLSRKTGSLIRTVAGKTSFDLLQEEAPNDVVHLLLHLRRISSLMNYEEYAAINTELLARQNERINFGSLVKRYEEDKSKVIVDGVNHNLYGEVLRVLGESQSDYHSPLLSSSGGINVRRRPHANVKITFDQALCYLMSSQKQKHERYTTLLMSANKDALLKSSMLVPFLDMISKNANPRDVLDAMHYLSSATKTLICNSEGLTEFDFMSRAGFKPEKIARRLSDTKNALGESWSDNIREVETRLAIGV